MIWLHKIRPGLTILLFLTAPAVTPVFGGPPAPRVQIELRGTSMPRDVALSSSRVPVSLGERITLLGEARDSDSPTRTFLFYVSESPDPDDPGTLIQSHQVIMCNVGCQRSVGFDTAAFPTAHFFQLEVRDGSSSVFSSKLEVEVLLGHPPASGMSCSCGQISVTTEAGPEEVSVLGVDSLSLEGEASGRFGSTPITQGTFVWTITNDGGLGPGLMIFDSDFLAATLATPDVTQDTDVTLQLDATFSECPCADTMIVHILADPPPDADLIVQKSSSVDTAPLNGTVFFEIGLENEGPDRADNVVLTDALPDGFSFVSAQASSGACGIQDSQVVCELGNLFEGQTRTITIEAQPTMLGSFENVAFALSDTPDADLFNNTAGSTVTVVENTFADLSLVKTDSDDPVRQDGNFSYLLTVTNLGPNQASNVVLTDSLPSAVDLLSVTSGQGDCSTDVDITCHLGTIGIDQVVEVDILVRAISIGQVTNTAFVVSNQIDPAPENNTSTESTEIEEASADLGIEKLADPNPVTPGKPLEYTLTVTNAGPDSAIDVQVVDQLPETLDFVSVESDRADCAESNGTVTCTLDTLVVEESFEVRIETNPESDSIIENTATVSSARPDPNQENNSDTVEVRVTASEFLAFPYSIPVEGTFVGVAALNLSGQPNVLRAQRLDSSGEVEDEFDFPRPLQDRQQAASLTTELFASGDSVLLRGLQGSIQGFFLLGDLSLDRFDGVGGRLRDDSRLFFPQARRAGPCNTLIYLFNPFEAGNTAVTLSLVDPAGAVLSQSSFQLQPRGSIHAGLDEFFDGTTSIEDGFVIAEADRPLRGYETVVEDRTFVTMAGSDAFETERLFSPHFFVGRSGQTTRIRLLNPTGDRALILVQAFDDSRKLIGEESFLVSANGLRVVDLATLLDIDTSSLEPLEVIQGFLELFVASEGPGKARLVPFITFDGGDAGTRSSLPLASTGETEILFLQVAQDPDSGIFHGLAIYNGNAELANVTVETFDSGGTLSGQSSFLLSGRARAIGLLNDPIYFGPQFVQSGGHLRVTSDLPVVVFSLYGGPRFLSAIEGQTPLN